MPILKGSKFIDVILSWVNIRHIPHTSQRSQNDTRYDASFIDKERKRYENQFSLIFVCTAFYTFFFVFNDDCHHFITTALTSVKEICSVMSSAHHKILLYL